MKNIFMLQHCMGAYFEEFFLALFCNPIFFNFFLSQNFILSKPKPSCILSLIFSHKEKHVRKT